MFLYQTHWLSQTTVHYFSTHSSAFHLSSADDSGPTNLTASSPTTVSDVTEKMRDVCVSKRNPRRARRCAYSGPRLPSFYINVFEEDDSTNSCLPDDNAALRADALLKQYLCTSKVDMEGRLEAKSGANARAEGYEKMTAKHGDEQFGRFQKRVQRFPQQVIR